jgi:hypothetical protein
MYMKLTLRATMTPQKAPLAAAAAYLRRQHECMQAARTSEEMALYLLSEGGLGESWFSPAQQSSICACVCYGGREEQKRRRMRTSITAAKAT